MQIRILVLSLLVFSSSIFANQQDLDEVFLNELKAKGLTVPGSGIHMVSLSSLKIHKDVKETWLREFDEFNKNGYISEYNERARELLDFSSTIGLHLKKYDNVTSDESTHIRRSVGQIKLAYDFHSLPMVNEHESLGFAPSGGFKNGWTGIVQFFKKRDWGVCAFTENNAAIANSSVSIAKELVTYDVNNNPSHVFVRGNNDSGFLYFVRWYGPIYYRTLECANNVYSHDILTKVINMAKEVDRL